MAKQLEMFPNLTQQIPQEELEKLKQLAASSDQDNIDLCCSLLDMYNYIFTQKCVFVFEQQISTISLEDWTWAVAWNGEVIKKEFSVDGEDFIIEDGLDVWNRDIKLWVYLKNYLTGSERMCIPLYDYNQWGSHDKDRPTDLSRKAQATAFLKIIKDYDNARNDYKNS